MNKAKELLIRQLKETICILEESDSSQKDLDILFRHWMLPSYDRNIIRKLDNIECLLRDQQSIKSQPCPLVEREGENNIFQLITGIENKINDEKKSIFSWLKGAENLIICDPYFFSFGKPKKYFKKQDNYIKFQQELIPNNLKNLDIFHFEGANRKIFNQFSKFCKDRKIKLRNYPTGLIHDRVLIKNNNNNTAKMLGTSFGGLGNKISFFVDLPNSDVKFFKKELHKIRTNA